MKNLQQSGHQLSTQLSELNYRDIFYFDQDGVIDNIWQDGKNSDSLLHIVAHPSYADYVRLLASEILFEKKADYPPPGWNDTLAFIYSRALVISGINEGEYLPGNSWGFMYHTDTFGITDVGNLGKHLISSGKFAIPYLIKLLNDDHILVYEGSRDATTGNSLKYRVKDAAAYYIGKIAEIPVQYFDKKIDRDAAIELLKEKLK